MNAIEFQTTIHDGVITLPSNQQSWNGKKIKVILLEEAHLNVTEISTEELASDADFFDCVGLWENRDIDQKSIRDKAWRDNKG